MEEFKDLYAEEEADPEEQRKEKQVLKREQELSDIKTLLGNPVGMRFFRRLMDEGLIFRPTFDIDHARSSFKEGHRNLVLKFLQDITQVAPDRLPELLLRETPKPEAEAEGSDSEDE